MVGMIVPCYHFRRGDPARAHSRFDMPAGQRVRRIVGSFVCIDHWLASVPDGANEKSPSLGGDGDLGKHCNALEEVI